MDLVKVQCLMTRLNRYSFMPEIKKHLKNLERLHRQQSRRDHLRLDMNEGIPGLPDDFVRDVLAEIDRDYLSMYPEYDSLIKKLADFNGISPENIFISNGSDAAIKQLFEVYVSPGDRVLLTDPTFAMYPVFCGMNEATAEYVEYRDDFTLAIGEFMERLSSSPRMAVLVNPNNPTGHVLKRNELLEVIRKAEECGVLLLIDEAYYYFHSQTIIGEINSCSHLVVLRTFSKLCGLAAARLGYIAASREIVNGLLKVKLGYDVNGIAVRLVERLLDRPELIEKMIEQTNDGKRYIVDRLRKAGLKFRCGEANFVLINCHGCANEVAKRLSEKGILVGGGFRQEFLKDYIRVTVGHRFVMERFCDALLSVIR